MFTNILLNSILSLWNWSSVLVKMVTASVECGWIHSKLERARRGQSTSLLFYTTSPAAWGRCKESVHFWLTEKSLACAFAQSISSCSFLVKMIPKTHSFSIELLTFLSCIIRWCFVTWDDPYNISKPFIVHHALHILERETK